ncbi:MAG: histidine kinase dimerization/phosphoacceptor domain -containing protein [Bryobacteraceae bacterium]
MRILIVDDSLADRKLYRILLEGKYGRSLDVVEATTATAGLEECQKLPATASACLLLDYKLPDMNGLQFIHKLAQQHSGRRFAIVMLTGLGNERIAAEAIKAGAQDYLVKDRITAESLQAAVENALEKVSLIDALKADRDRLAHSIGELARTLEEKDVLLHEVHHRVKNNLQVIASLLRLQAERVEAAAGDARVTQALRDSQYRVESMALVHEQLYATPLSPKGSVREVDLAAFSASLAQNLSHAYGVDSHRIRCRVNLEPVSEPLDRAIPTGLILNELLSNAFEHAFPDNRSGTVSLEGRNTGDRIEFRVEDDGVGIREGADRGTQTLGFEIVRILSRQLRGTFEVRKENGTVCRLSYPNQRALSASGGIG